MGLILRTAPALEPVTVRDVTRHLRLDSTNTEPIPSVPTVALAALGAGNVDNGAHRYRLTFVTIDGETDGGDISDVVTVVDKTANGQVALSNLTLGGSQVTARRIYRTKAGADLFFLVATIADNTTLVYTDTIADAALGAGCPSVNTTADPYFANLITAAREAAEVYLKRALIRQQWTLVLDALPDQDERIIRLPMPPLISIDEFRYRQWSGDWAVLDASIWEAHTEFLPGLITRQYSEIWPPVLPQAGSVQIDFTCGYGAARSSVPRAISAGILALVAELYMNREASLVGAGNAVVVPPGVERLWATHRYVECY